MRHLKRILFISGFSLLALSIGACKKIKKDTKITVTNTLETIAGTGGAETPIETVLGAPEGSLASSATLSDNVEFKNFLGLYDIDLSDKSISFDLVAKADDATYSAFYRTLEAGTFDRYYLKFDKDHRINEGESNDSSVKLKVLSDTEILVEIGQGFEYQPGTTFNITLK